MRWNMGCACGPCATGAPHAFPEKQGVVRRQARQYGMGNVTPNPPSGKKFYAGVYCVDYATALRTFLVTQCSEKVSQIQMVGQIS